MTYLRELSLYFYSMQSNIKLLAERGSTQAVRDAALRVEESLGNTLNHWRESGLAAAVEVGDQYVTPEMLMAMIPLYADLQKAISEMTAAVAAEESGDG